MGVGMVCCAAFAQNYSIDWFKIAGGGGTSASTNAQYVLSGTIGQADAGPTMTNGQYSLSGGFWSIGVVQTPGAPFLSIRRQGTSYVVSWPSGSTGFALQSTANLSTPAWLGFGGSTNDDGTNKSVTILPSGGSAFFRLAK